ncbi:hypothetical protein D3C73_1064450 [compost metagenome]
MGRGWQVVEAEDRYLFRDFDPVAHRFKQRALGQVVVAEENRIDIGMAGDHLQKQFATQAYGRRARGQHFQGRVIQAGLL